MGSIDDFSQLCRLCLVKDQVNQSIFDESSHIGQISVKINSCLPVQVSPDDDLPKKICDGCSYKLETLYIFRNTSVESEKQLKSWLSRSQSKDHSPDVKPEETITVKEETLDSSETADLNNYLIPYEQGIEFVATTESSEPPSKRARLAPTLKHLPLEETFGSDVDNDLDLIMPVLKTEEEDSDYGNQQDFVEVPSTSAEGQTSHPGVANAAVEAPCGDLSVKVEEPESSKNSKGGQNLCKLCNATFPAYKILRKHRKDFHTPKSFCCPVCNKMFKDQWNLTKHVEIHSEEKKYYCEECDQHLKTYQQLQEHRRRHRNPNGLICSECRKVFLSPSSFRKHCLLHKGIRYSCDKCEKNYSDPATLKSHLKTHQEDFVPKSYTCEICHKVFTEELKLKKHVAIYHEGKRKWLICETCGRKMSSQKSLRDHQLIHTNEKPYKCDKCERSFRKKEHLTDHVRIHKNEFPYNCSSCEKNFTSRSSLKFHMAKHHEGKRHLCATCGKALASAESLKVHTRQHTGEKPFACSYCGKSFAKKQDMTVHLIVHTKEKPHVCKICEKSYTQVSSLSLHMRAVHQGHTPHECHICGKSFVTRSVLTNHQKAHLVSFN